jgi:hypothetical protein
MRKSHRCHSRMWSHPRSFISEGLPPIRRNQARQSLSIRTYSATSQCRKCIQISDLPLTRGIPNRTISHGKRIRSSTFNSSFPRAYIKTSGLIRRKLWLFVRGIKGPCLEFFTPSFRPQFMSWLQVICSEVVLRRQDLKRTAHERRKAGYNYYPKHATPLYYAA